MYSYDAYGVESTLYYNGGSNTRAFYNPFRYRGYYYDRDLSLYYLSTRYYDCRTGRFVSPDNMGYLGANGDLSSYNLYAYCSNNPIMFTDPSGHMPQWLKTVIDIGLYVVSAGISAPVGVVVSKVAGPADGTVAAIATFGALNNLTNAVYYNCFSDGESDLTATSYRDGYINRLDRLDYTKSQTEQDYYNTTAWLYYSEYNLHMYGWFAFGWAYETGVKPFSDWAESASEADIDVGSLDRNDWYVNAGTLIVGLTGI